MAFVYWGDPERRKPAAGVELVDSAGVAGGDCLPARDVPAGGDCDSTGGSGLAAGTSAAAVVGALADGGEV